MPSRRAVLAAGAITLGGVVGGCTGLGNSAEFNRSYDDYVGPAMLDSQSVYYGKDAEKMRYYNFTITTTRPSELVDNEYLDEMIKIDWTDVPHSTVGDTVEAADVSLHLTTGNETIEVIYGTFNRGPINNHVSDRSEHIDTYRQHDIHVQKMEYGENEETYYVTAVGSEQIIELRGNDRDVTIGRMKGVLNTAAGETDRLVGTNEDAKLLAENLGNGDWTEVTYFGMNWGYGKTMNVNGETTERRAVALYPSASKAKNSSLGRESEIEELRDSTVEQRRLGSQRGKWAPYENFEYERDGRVITLSGTIDTNEISSVDRQFP